MKAKSEQEAVAFATWLWHNYICYYSRGEGQWLGHTDNKVYTTEALYEQWIKTVQGEQSISEQDENAANHLTNPPLISDPHTQLESSINRFKKETGGENE